MLIIIKIAEDVVLRFMSPVSKVKLREVKYYTETVKIVVVNTNNYDSFKTYIPCTDKYLHVNILVISYLRT